MQSKRSSAGGNADMNEKWLWVEIADIIRKQYEQLLITDWLLELTVW